MISSTHYKDTLCTITKPESQKFKKYHIKNHNSISPFVVFLHPLFRMTQ